MEPLLDFVGVLLCVLEPFPSFLGV